MKNVSLSKIFIVLFTLSFFGCNNSKTSKNVSSATGWAINSRDGGFQYNTNYKGQEAGPGLIFIEGGTYTKGKVQDDVMKDWNNTPNQQHVMSFYMDETEVTNAMYLEYLFWIKENFPPSNENFADIYKGALPDTLVWRNRLGYTEDLVENYLRNPAYGNYPVVGVSWIQATEFAKWRTDRYNEIILMNDGYLATTRELNGKGRRGQENEDEVKEKATGSEANFSTETYLLNPNEIFGSRNNDRLNGRVNQKNSKDTTSTDLKSASRETGLISPKYRLPTESEWEYAALALKENRDFNMYRGRKKYPWSGQYTRSGERKILGDQLSNFKNSDGDYGGISGWSDDGADITNQVKSYAPNDFGLYDMAGNVSEWVADVYRPIVDDEFNDFNYYRGNVYTKNKINKNGTTESTIILDDDKVDYTTLSNGSKVATTLPGELQKEKVNEDDTKYRTNYSESYNINFRDGDQRSSRNFLDLEESTGKMIISGSEDTKKMYNSPNLNLKDDQNKSTYDSSNKRTSMVNDQARVYKGGSWKDRAYWLDPAQRRFYPEDMSTDFIGFRCAMSRLGSKTLNSGSKRRN
ncbi:MAG: gliding motility lipoprotein GldJ [Flavobacteriaceae bacterium]|nr:gliding motility lipoprotein GldJ [Flavobacteriaceae bacterium]